MKTRLKVRSGRVSDPRLAQLPLQLKCSRRRHPILGLAHPLSHAALCTVRAPDDEEYGEEDEEYGEEEDFDDDEVPPATRLFASCG